MQIKKVCVIGMGTMGSQIGIVCAGGGYETAMVDTTQDQVENGLKGIQSFWKAGRKRGRSIRKQRKRYDPLSPLAQISEMLCQMLIWSSRLYTRI